MSAEKRQLVNELHTPARKTFTRRRVIVRGYDDLWQADLVDMRAYSRMNSGNQYILTVIDVLTKYAWAQPIKNKQAKTVVAAFNKILLDNRKPKNLQTDDGKEFFNNEFKNFITKHDINHYSTYSVMKASVVERWNRTLKNDMWKMFTLHGNYKWLNSLQELVNNYNNRIHRTIKMKPADVTPKIAKQLLKSVYSNIKVAGPSRFKAGDYVRISKYKSIFAKGYTPNWTTEIFQITKVQQTNPATYLLKDSSGNDIYGGFYEQELLPTKNSDVYLVEKVLRKKGKQVYVKWLGLDSSHNSWINKTNVL